MSDDLPLLPPSPFQLLEVEHGNPGVVSVRSPTGEACATVVDVERFTPLLVDPWNVVGPAIALLPADYFPAAPVTILRPSLALGLAAALETSLFALAHGEVGVEQRVEQSCRVRVTEADEPGETRRVAVDDYAWAFLGGTPELGIAAGEVAAVAAAIRMLAERALERG
jgi:hypothetical protein